MYHTKKIGVFISHIFGFYQKNVCQGIIDKATEFGYSVEIFTSLDGENIGNYKNGDTYILTLPNYDSYCGIIFVSGTYLAKDLKEQILIQLKDKATCPVIEITSSASSFTHITLDNNMPIEDMVKHFVLVHHCKRICYLGNTIEKEISLVRQNHYENAMQNFSLKIGIHDIFHGNYDFESSKDAFAFFSKENLPDAIICYNDRMALNLMSEANLLGYHIPEDFAISGFDDTLDGKNVVPALTSVSFPVYELGTSAILQLMKVLQGILIEDSFTITSTLCIRESCGCTPKEHPNPIFHIQNLNHYTSNLEFSMIQSMRMSSEFQHITDIDEGMLLLKKYISCIEHCKEFYLCLYPGWDFVSSQMFDFSSSMQPAEDAAEEVILKLAVKNGKELPECTFLKKNLIPEIAGNEIAGAYVFTPLFFEEKNFGYIALSYEHNQMDYHFQLISWVMNINQMLQGICKIKFTSYMEQKLEEIYMKDPLTGFYNKHGYNYFKQIFLKHACTCKNPVGCFIFDLNHLKQINETYGRSEGDFAIQIFGHALEHHISGNDLCARFDDDTFYLFAADSTKESALDLLQKIERYLNNYNSLSSKAYSVSVSFGFALAKAEEQPTPELLHKLFHLAELDLAAKKSV